MQWNKNRVINETNNLICSFNGDVELNEILQGYAGVSIFNAEGRGININMYVDNPNTYDKEKFKIEESTINVKDIDSLISTLTEYRNAFVNEANKLGITKFA